MKKLTEEQRKELVLSYRLDNSKPNIKSLIKQYNISEQRLFQIVKEDKNKDLCITDNTDNFSKRANEIIEKAFNRLEERLETDEKATISQLATLIGILYDKSRLESGLSTENKAISINIKIE